MKGGAIPVLVWFVLNGILFVIHLLMTGHAQADGLGAWLAAFALGILLVWILYTGAENRETLHRGAPELHVDTEALPAASLGAPLLALAFVACGFGLVFGAFLVLIAAGIFVGAVFLLIREIRDERRSRRAWSEDGGAE